jgi:5-methylcytosine-specific restriction endonuclease McrA
MHHQEDARKIRMELSSNRLCLRPAIPEIALAAKYLNDAASSHISGRLKDADELIRAANIPAIKDWVESLWGKASPYVQYRAVPNGPPTLSRAERLVLRMPTAADKRSLLERDGYHCRFCGIPVIRKEVRDRLRKFYPEALPWPTDSNKAQHPAFQAMWVQFDHVLAHARGGTNDFDNLIVTCAPCNYGRMNYTLEEVGLADPRLREPIRSTWDGLERLLQHQNAPVRIAVR